MMFSTKAEYGIRVMVELARQPGEEPIPLAEIAGPRRPAAAYPRAFWFRASCARRLW